MLEKMLEFKEVIRSAIFLLAFLSISACGSLKTEPQKINHCVRSKTDRVFKIVYGVNTELNAYRMVRAIEKGLIDNGLMQGIDKDSYLKLLNEVVLKQNNRLVEYKMFKEFSFISGMIVVDMISNCPHEIITKDKNNLNSLLVRQFQLTDLLFASGYSYDKILEYMGELNDQEFEKVEYRAPVMIMLLCKLESIYRNN